MTPLLSALETRQRVEAFFAADPAAVSLVAEVRSEAAWANGREFLAIQRGPAGEAQLLAICSNEAAAQAWLAEGRQPIPWPGEMVVRGAPIVAEEEERAALAEALRLRRLVTDAGLAVSERRQLLNLLIAAEARYHALTGRLVPGSDR